MVWQLFTVQISDRPIEQLNRTAGRIAEGDLEKRAAYQGADEIGELSRSFNRMTDRLVRQMEEKELEAKTEGGFYGGICS